jgi:hypothetical protein
MLNTAEKSLIQGRYNKAKDRRAYLLGLKKSERGNKLKEVEKTLSTLKRWLS